jgi:precorrin-8X/cobalt-precorrin-8 methylmutase
MTRTVHPIEEESYRILRSVVDLSHLPPLSRAVTERIIHASADPRYSDDLVLDEASLLSGLAALRAGAEVVVDARMVAAGITVRSVRCILDKEVDDATPTRCAAAVRRSAATLPAGAVWVIGCAPSALAAILECDARPALVIGMPVGFVGAVEAKKALVASGLPAISNRSARGGSAVAAAALNALLYHGLSCGLSHGSQT